MADAPPMPVGICNNPPRVKTDLDVPDMLRSARHPRIAVLKESAARVSQVCAAAPDVSIMRRCPPNLGLAVQAVSLGGHGAASMTGTIIPAEMAAISTLWLADRAQAIRFREEYLRCLPMLHFVYSAINPVPVKFLMQA